MAIKVIQKNAKKKFGPLVLPDNARMLQRVARRNNSPNSSATPSRCNAGEGDLDLGASYATSPESFRRFWAKN